MDTLCQPDCSLRRCTRRLSLGLGVLKVAQPSVPAIPIYNNRVETPWFERTLRWAQTNITEIDPTRYDIDWWVNHWRQTCVQGVILNAGGIFTYYQSSLPLTHPAAFLGERDLFGELVQAARRENLAVLARMDSNRVHEKFFLEHPDWIAVNQEGEPYRAGDMYITCINSPYYEEYLPRILQEICEKYHPDGFTDNSFSGLSRRSISYSPYAAARFRNITGQELPSRVDWDDPVYRTWLQTSYQRRLEIWDLNNRTVRQAGGKDCLWMGMVGGDVVHQCESFRDLKEICSRSKMVMLDFQSRTASAGFKQNAETGKLIHNLVGWDKVVIESMAMYAHAQPFRVSSAPELEARMWMVEGFAGGISPWYHHIGAYHEDRRQYKTAEPLMRWHEKNQQFLINRTPIAPVGVVWSQDNVDGFGRDQADIRFSMPWQGMTEALIRARIPYLPLHADSLERLQGEIKALILPSFGVVSDSQLAAVRQFVQSGGSLVMTGETGRYDTDGHERSESVISEWFGMLFTDRVHGSMDPSRASWDDWSHHSYLRLHPGKIGQIYGPGEDNNQVSHAERHPALAGLDETDIIPFGGQLQEISVSPASQVLLTFIPPFPVYPPETAWMRQADSGIPGLVVGETGYGGRFAFLAADLDRCYARYHLPDHALLLGNLAKWAAGGDLPFQVEGDGLLDCHLYSQERRLILHLVNLTGTSERPLEHFVRVGPIRVRIFLGNGCAGRQVWSLVDEKELPAQIRANWISFILPTIFDHEVVVIE